jgi:MoaD family protein
MNIRVNIPSALKSYTQGISVVELFGKNVKEVLQGLTTQYPELKKHLLQENGSLRGFVNVFVNDEDIRFLSQLDTPLKEGDELNIIPSIAGGTP